MSDASDDGSEATRGCPIVLKVTLDKIGLAGPLSESLLLTVTGSQITEYEYIWEVSRTCDQDCLQWKVEV